MPRTSRAIRLSEMRVGDEFAGNRRTTRPEYRLVAIEPAGTSYYGDRQWTVRYVEINARGEVTWTSGTSNWTETEYFVFRTDAMPAPVVSHLGTLAINAMGTTLYRTLDNPGVLDIASEWASWCAHQDSGDGDGFSTMVNALWTVDVYWCDDCQEPADIDNTCDINGDRNVCGSCIGQYELCDMCRTYGARGGTSYRSGFGDICESCIEDISYCKTCGECYRNDDDRQVEKHEHRPCCTSPVLNFDIRNDGEPALTNDTRVTITLPKGIIDDAGLERIRQTLYWSESHTYDYSWVYNAVIDTIGDKWQTTEGNFTKRLSRAAYKMAKQMVADCQWTQAEADKRGKIPTDILSTIGTIAREHSSGEASFNLEITRDLNRTAAEFGHSGSCWWGGGSYGYSRCAAKNSGTFGLRTYGTSERQEDDEYPSGRIWVQPLRDNGSGDLVPTFDALNADAYVVFNGYGIFEGSSIVAARILGQMAGMSYRKIGFGFSPMYINNGNGYLVAGADLIATTSSLYFDMDNRGHSAQFHDFAGAYATDESNDDCTCCSAGAGCCACPIHYVYN